MPVTGPQTISADETLENNVYLEDDRYVHVRTVHNFIKIFYKLIDIFPISDLMLSTGCMCVEQCHRMIKSFNF